MDKLYKDIIEELLKKIQDYSKDEIPYEELRKAFLREELAFRHPEWDSVEASVRKEIFEVENGLYSHLRRVEVQLKSKDKEDVVDVKGLISHSRMISRNKMPLESYSNSLWYLPFCPNHNNVESLYEEDSTK